MIHKDTRRVNGAGCYLVKFYINGAIKHVIVDDYIPVDRESGEPTFMMSSDDVLWALLIEKAWAKVNGSYYNILGSFPSFLSNHLTGAPSCHLSHAEAVTIEDRIVTSDPDLVNSIWVKI